MSAWKTIRNSIVVIFLIMQPAFSSELLTKEPFDYKWIFNDGFEIEGSISFSINNDVLTGTYEYTYEGKQQGGDLTDISVENQNVEATWNQGGKSGTYYLTFDKEFKSFQGHFYFNNGAPGAIMLGKNSTYQGTQVVEISPEKILEGWNVCLYENKSRCDYYTRVLTPEEFIQIFNGKVFKAGRSVGGSQGTEFMFNTDDMTYTFLTDDGEIKTRKLGFERGITVCFNSGSGPCIEDTYALIDAERDPIGGVLNDTFHIYYKWDRGIGKFFDCGIEGIDQGVLITPRICSVEPYKKTYTVAGTGESVEINTNEFAFIAPDKTYFDSPKIAATKNAGTLKTVADLYTTYQQIDDYCGETIDLGDLQQEINSIIGLMASEKELSEDAVTQIKDDAWEQGLSQNKKDSEFQQMSIMYAGMNSADRKKACQTAFDEITSTYRTMRVAMEKAVKKDEKKKRSF